MTHPAIGEVIDEKISVPDHENARGNCGDRFQDRRLLLLLQEGKIKVILHRRERAERVALNLPREDSDRSQDQALDHHHPPNQVEEMKNEKDSARNKDEKRKKSAKKRERNVNRNAG